MENDVKLAAKPVDAKVVVVLARENMEARVRVVAPQNGGEDVTEERVREALAAKKIVYGLDEEAIREAGRQPVYGEDYLVARGTPPEKGRSAVLKFLFETQVDIRPREREDGSVDYHDLGLIQHVQAGQKLCEKTPATKGTDGVNVLGKPVRAKAGRDLPFPRGRNTAVSDDGLFLVAETAGHVEYVGRRVSVYDIYTIEGDVGPATGSIDFEGSVSVTGSVLSGYSVKAQGDITIRGACETVTIRSGGNVIIGEGINRGTIEAVGDVRCEYIQSCKVYAEGNVYAGSIINSSVSCGGSVTATGPKGTIVGGSVTASAKIEAMFIGAKNSVIPTYIEVGLSPLVQKRVREIPEEIEQTVKAISDLDKAITLLSQLAKTGKLDAEKAEKLKAAANTRGVEYDRYLSLSEEREYLEEKAQKLGYGKVITRGRISPGVKIVIGPHQMTVSDDLPSPKITRGTDGLLVRSAY